MTPEPTGSATASSAASASLNTFAASRPATTDETFIFSLPFMSPAPYNGCLLNVSSAELASRAAASTCARRSALEQEGPLALIAGERGRVLELAPRLDHAADPE